MKALKMLDIYFELYKIYTRTMSIRGKESNWKLSQWYSLDDPFKTLSINFSLSHCDDTLQKVVKLKEQKETLTNLLTFIKGVKHGTGADQHSEQVSGNPGSGT